MLKATVTAWQTSNPYLGVGSYYHRPDESTELRHDDWVVVTLEQPLILNSRQVRMLVQKYGTDSSDRMTAMAGAWTLRREILQMGHDGIIAFGSSAEESRLTLVAFTRPPDAQHESDHGVSRSGAQISRLPSARLSPGTVHSHATHGAMPHSADEQ